jgi:hypothetical protein
MITFLECMKYDDDENVAIKLKNEVRELQTKYGNRSCSCHPNYKWEIAVDILEEDVYDIHTTGDALKMPCDLVKNMIEKEIKPFLNHRG